MRYDSGFCLINVQALAVYFADAPSQLFWEGKLGKPKEEIENLNGFEYMYLRDLKIPYLLYSSSKELLREIERQRELGDTGLLEEDKSSGEFGGVGDHIGGTTALLAPSH